MRPFARYWILGLLSLVILSLTSCGAYIGASGYPDDSYMYNEPYYYGYPPEPYGYGYYGYYGHPYYRGGHEERERTEHGRSEHEERERGERGEHHR